MLHHRSLAGMENPREKIGHFYTVWHPDTALVAVAVGYPLVAFHDPLRVIGFTFLPGMKHGLMQLTRGTVSWAHLE